MTVGIQPFEGRARNAIRVAVEEKPRLTDYDGAVRSGKTITSIFDWLHHIRHGPPGALLMAGRTERTVARNVVAPITEMFGSARAKWNSGVGELTVAGRTIYVVGANDRQAEEKIRGLTLAGAYLDEATVAPEGFFKMMLSRLSVPGARFIWTTNPDAPRHWLNVDYLARADELGLRRHIFTLDDNPHLDPEYKRAIMREYTGLWRKRFIDGLWVMAEGAIYDMLDEDRHTVDTEGLPRFLETWAVGVDYGTTNPTTWFALSLGADQRLYIHDEYRWDSSKTGRQKADSEYVTDWEAWLIRTRLNPKRLYIDPSAASYSRALYRAGERRIVPADNSVVDGIREVATLLSLDLLRFHLPTTQTLWDEMQGYVWDKKAQEKGIDAPLKVNDHGPDALRYAVRGTRLRWRRLLPTGYELKEKV